MNILIVGASRGIGFEVVRLLSQQTGHRIFAVGRQPHRLAALSASLPASEVHVLTCDISQHHAAAYLSDTLSAHCSSLDILINNAALLHVEPFTELKRTEVEQMMNTNFVAPALITSALVPLLKQSANGSHVVNIGSMGGFQGSVKFSGLSVYSATKAALACLTECMSVELMPLGITPNCLCLGAVETEMFAEAFAPLQAPLRASQMAEYIVWFAFNGANYFRGKIIPVATTTP